MFLCVALAVLNIQSYARHLSTGDQAGFALGTFFLGAWFLPIPAVLLLIPAIWVPIQEESRVQRGIAMVALIAGAGFFLAYGVWMKATDLPPIAFSLNVLACALAIRPGVALPRGGGQRWLSGMILASAAILIFQITTMVPNIEGKHLVSAQVVGQFLFMAWPTLAWVAALLWSVWLLQRRRESAASFPR